MEQSVIDSPVVLVIKASDQKYDDQTINCFLSWTVEKLKSHLSNVYPSKPRSKDQRLVYSGKLLQDHCTLRDVLRKQDEFHMLHLVCASRSPPSSPTTHRKKDNQVVSAESGPPASGDNNQTASSEESPDRLNQNSGSTYNHSSLQGSAWAQWFDQHRHNTRISPYPMYNPLTLLWWQQLYAWQCHVSYQTWVASIRLSQQSSLPPVAPPRQRQDMARENPQNGRVREAQNQGDLNRDWLDWVYAASRAIVLLSFVYFYSSFSRFVMVTGAMVLLYLHQAGWLPFNLDNELQDIADAANQDEPNAENNNNQQNMGQMADEGEEDDEQRGEGPDDERWINMGFFSSTWSFLTTFFTSLIPEAAPNAMN